MNTSMRKKTAVEAGLEHLGRGTTSGMDQFILEKIPAEDFLGFIHYHPSIMEPDRLGKSPYDCSPELVKEVKDIVQRTGGENL